MGRFATVLITMVGLAGPCALAAAPAGKAPASSGPAAKVVRLGAVRLHPARRRVHLDTEVCLREGMLEFLLVGWQTKTHESILHTKAKASHLHAALLMLGLSAGKPARWSGEEPGARFLPPAGAHLKIELAWKDKKGKARRAKAGTWLTGREGKQFQPPEEWIFIGSDVMPDGRYWAELDGEIVSVTNFASAVIDVPFRSSNANEQRELFANTRVIPPVGTKVEMIITALPGGEKAPDARATLEVDRFGRTRVDGREFHGEKLQEWASKFIERHERGQVVIRAAARALVHDVETARMDLRLGGVRELLVQRLAANVRILPRTADQAKRGLKQWADKFAHAEDLIHDPGEQAQQTLDQIELYLQQQQARRNMLKEYAEHLRQAMRRYKVSTQPAGKPAGSSGSKGR